MVFLHTSDHNSHRLSQTTDNHYFTINRLRQITQAIYYKGLLFNNLRLTFKKVPEPEVVVGLLEVGALVAAVAVEAVWVDHEVELLAGFVESVQELKGVLVMDVIVTCAMGQFQHYRLDRPGIVFCRVAFYIVQDL